MKSLRIPGRIDENNQLILDKSLAVIKPQQVEIDVWLLDDDLEDYYEPTKEEILEGLREGLHDCLTGNTSPVSGLWDELRIKTTAEINEEGQLILDYPLRETHPQYVDVVIWFVKYNKLPENICEDGFKTQVKELTMSQK